MIASFIFIVMQFRIQGKTGTKISKLREFIIFSSLPFMIMIIYLVKLS